MTNEERIEVRSLLWEAIGSYSAGSYTVPPAQRIRTAWVAYYAITPRGSKARFTRSIGLSQTRGAQSETAIYFYLKGLHPSCDIQIQRMELR
jgi:hypothetical protein